MPGEIKHEWNGTVLTITSDSGTSSSDLRGAKGDDGIRGPQGLPGECLHRHELPLTEEQKATGRKNINAYRAINEKGNPIEFEANAGLALSAVSAIEPIQAGTGEASPDNVRAISGFDKIHLYIHGENLLNGRVIKAGSSSGKLTAFNNCSSYEAKVKPGMSIKVLRKENVIGNRFIVGLAKTQYKGIDIEIEEYGNYYSMPTQFLITIPDEYEWLYLYVDNESKQTNISDYCVAETSKEGFIEYKGTAATVNLPSTIYGGEYDWKTGKLVVDRECVEFNGTENWYSANWGGTPVIALNLTKSYKSSIIKSHFNTELYKSDNLIVLNNTKYNYTLESWKTYLQQQKAAGTPLQVIMRLETPETYYLTPYDFETIEGLNTVWSNTGETTITNLKGNAEALRNIMERIAALEDNIGG